MPARLRLKTPDERLATWCIVPGKPRRARTLNPVRPSAAIELAYRRKILRLIDEMHSSVMWFVPAAYRANEPELTALLARDESPAAGLRDAVRRLRRRWQRRFDDAAQDLARYFATSVAERSGVALRSILRRGGFAVEPRYTRAVNDLVQAAVHENVSLIRSISAQHFTAVEGAVMRSVQTGRDLKQLSDDLQHLFGVTKRRAALISRDQNNKATASLNRARQLELGLSEAVWVHSHASREPRPSHVRAGRDKVRFSIVDGWYDPDEKRNVHPGELINCRCQSRPIVPGFN